MKILHNASEEVDISGEGFTIAYSLASVQNGPSQDGELYVPLNTFHAQDKESLRRILHEDIDRFVDGINEVSVA